MSEPCLEEKLVYIFKKASEGILPDDPNPNQKISVKDFSEFLGKLFTLLMQAFKEV